MSTTRNFSSLRIGILACFIICLPSCSDEWKSHYGKDGQGMQGKNLYDLIKADASLSNFNQLIDISGYNEFLSSGQTLTVWAPRNEALEDIDMMDTAFVRLTVGNHISRFNYSTSTPADKAIRMVSGKVHHFSGSGDISFGGCLLISRDNLAKNGILHTIDRPVAYSYNIYEFINSQPDVSKLHGFLSTWIEEKGSGDGYDIVGTFYNPLLQDKKYGLGSILSEDSAYTMLMPTNAAWDAAYTRISPYFNVYDKNKEIADSMKRVQTSLAILGDLIYRGWITDPAQSGSLVSTSGSVIRNAGDLFRGATLVNASNGLIYLTSNIRYDNVETWNKEIRVECENQEGRATGENTNIYTRVVDANSTVTDVSGNRYIEVQPKNPVAQPAVTFDISDILSGQYDIYAEFIPAVIEGESYRNDSTKLNFTLKYLAPDGSIQSQTSNNHITSGYKKVRIKVFDAFAFPVSDYHDRLRMMDKANIIQNAASTTKLEIKTNVSSIEFNTGRYTRRFRIDRIVFDPIRN
jgi:hypothetical protein